MSEKQEAFCRGYPELLLTFLSLRDLVFYREPFLVTQIRLTPNALVPGVSLKWRPSQQDTPHLKPQGLVEEWARELSLRRDLWTTETLGERKTPGGHGLQGFCLEQRGL